MAHETNVPAGPPAEASLASGYELRDTNVRAIVTFLVFLTVFIVVVQVILWGLLRALSSDKPEDTGPLTNPETIHVQRQALNAREDEQLKAVQAAIDKIAETGLAPVPARTAVEVNGHAGKPAGDGQSKEPPKNSEPSKAERPDEESARPKEKNRGQDGTKDSAGGQPGQGSNR